MKKKIIVIVSMLLFAGLIGGCADKGDVQGQRADTEVMAESSGETEASELPDGTDIAELSDGTDTAEPSDRTGTSELPDGIYTAEFQTDSGMFHVNEACDGKGTLTIENGKMTIHVSLVSKNIVNLYPGLAEDAQKDGAKLLLPTEDTVTYSDGMTEEVYGFDVPVPVLEKEFDLALIGTKGQWYDHKVSVSNPVPLEDGAQTESAAGQKDDAKVKREAELKDGTQAKSAADLKDGTYTIEFAFEGGSGKAEILSPATLTITGEDVTATVQWDSPNYDYMIVNGEKYLPVNTEGDSVFEIPVLSFDQPMEVIGDTVAMSKPHEVEYTLTFHSDTMKPVD